MRDFSTRKLTFAAVVAAAYAALTMLLLPISYGPLQFRLSEALCILPFFFPFSAWGLFIGCVIANVLSAYGIIDVVFGSAATLIAAAATARIGMAQRDSTIRKALACAPPVISNAIIVGAIIAYATTESWDAFLPAMLVNGLQVGFGELAVMYVIGLPLLVFLPKTEIYAKLSHEYSRS